MTKHNGRSIKSEAVRDTLGRSLRDLRISVTDRCNFRCSYCMPEEVYGEKYHFLPRQEILTFEEISRVTTVLVGLGARKVRITGGEPLLRAELPTLVAMLSNTAGVKDLALTTNGSLLARQARDLSDAGLHRVTVSLDSLDDAVFRRLNGNKSAVVPVLEGIRAAGEAGLTPIKINAVVKRGVNDHTLVDLARHFQGTGHIVRFIEYMDVGTKNGWKLDDVVTADEIISRIDGELPIESLPPNYPGEVARRLRYKDGSGEIGVIPSVTKPFCGGCTRLRLSADGRLFTCLFGSEGTDLKALLRSGASDRDLRDTVIKTWLRRDDRYSEKRTGNTDLSAGPRKVEMYQIGG